MRNIYVIINNVLNIEEIRVNVLNLENVIIISIYHRYFGDLIRDIRNE